MVVIDKVVVGCFLCVLWNTSPAACYMGSLAQSMADWNAKAEAQKCLSDCRSDNACKQVCVQMHQIYMQKRAQENAECNVRQPAPNPTYRCRPDGGGGMRCDAY